MKHKSFFLSLTLWGAFLTLVTAVTPKICTIIDDAVAGKPVKATDVGEVITICATSAVTFVGRLNAQSALYTPKGVLGPNKPEDEA